MKEYSKENNVPNNIIRIKFVIQRETRATSEANHINRVVNVNFHRKNKYRTTK